MKITAEHLANFLLNYRPEQATEQDDDFLTLLSKIIVDGADGQGRKQRRRIGIKKNNNQNISLTNLRGHSVHETKKQ